jgi:hypothetical protein
VCVSGGKGGKGLEMLKNFGNETCVKAVTWRTEAKMGA